MTLYVKINSYTNTSTEMADRGLSVRIGRIQELTRQLKVLEMDHHRKEN